MIEEQLIEAVKEHRELYDTKHENYMKINLKNRIWACIANDLNLKDGEETKTLWFKLRNSYRDARRRQLRRLKSGAAPENIKPWKFQNQMSFLEHCMTAGPREGNVNDDSDDDSQLPLATLASNDSVESENVERNNSSDSEISHVADNNGDNCDGSNRETEFSLLHTVTPTTVAQSKQSNKRKQDDLRSILKRSVRQREERARHQRAEERRTLESNSITNNPLYNFFISMYQLTKNMPPNYQHVVRNKLFQAVSQAEEEIMNITSRPND